VGRVEKFSVIKAFQSVDRAEIVLLMMDATEPVTEQDARIAGYAFEKGRAIILLLNKWDLVEKDNNTHTRFTEMVRDGLKYIDHAPILTMSATKGTRAVKIFGLIDDLSQRYRKRVSTAEVNRFLEGVTAHQPPGLHHRGRRIKIYYVTQVQASPPTFMFFCNYPESIHFSYRRFLENRLRESFEFGGSPLKLVFKKRVEKTPRKRGGKR
jgi:GTP-binding protein